MDWFRYDEVDSTNDAAKQLIADGTIKRDVIVVARAQTAGRGTQGRSWSSPRDAGVYLSLVSMNVGPATADTALFTIAAGVGCAETLRETTGLDARVKPVNDLFAGGGKLGGILTEAVVEENRVISIITGIGVNTRRAERSLPDGSVRAVSLEELLPPARFASWNQDAFVERLAGAVHARQAMVTSGRCDELRRMWQGMLVDQTGSRAR